MGVFEPEDGLEFSNSHVLVDFLILRKLLVLSKGVLPFALGQRRYYTHNRLPIHHRQSRLRQSGHTAQNHHREYRDATNQQPHGDRFLASVYKRVHESESRSRVLRVCQSNRLNIKELLVPPKPKLFDITRFSTVPVCVSRTIGNPFAFGSSSSIFAEPAIKPCSIISRQ